MQLMIVSVKKLRRVGLELKHCLRSGYPELIKPGINETPRAAGCHLPYGITQCYRSPDTSEHTPPEPQPEAGTRFTYPGGMES